MGKKMDKKNVIWGEQHSVSLASFANGHMTAIVKLIQDRIGPEVKINTAAAQIAVNKAKNNPKMKNGYVKVGLIGTDLVLRCKEKKFLGDIEVDAILVPKYPDKARLWPMRKLELDLDKLEEAQRLEQQRKVRVQRLEQDRLVKAQLLEEQRKSKAQREQLTRKSSVQVMDEPPKPNVQVQDEPPKPKVQSEEELRQAKAERLHKVMNTPDEEGDTMRTKILRAAKNAQKLGVGDYAKGKLKEQGLTPMDERYHGEAIDPKNRYGRYMPELRALWEKHASQLKSYGKWLDDAEAGRVGVAGVKEALALKKPSNEGGGPIISQGEVAGGRVLYLDDDARKEYAARISKGVIAGGKPAGNNTIFVIGSDNTVYVGGKARGGGGKNAFNHSSFFAGGPVRSAGSLKLSGSRIVEVNDVSGHYTPSKEMVVTAVRKFAGGDQAWLGEVQVKIGSAGPITGAALLGEAHEKDSNEIWGKYSAGKITRVAAGMALMLAEDGNWLVRVGSNDKLVISYRKGDDVQQDLITSIGAKGLDRKKLLSPKQVTDLLDSLPKTTATPKSNGENEQRERQSQEKSSTPPQPFTRTRPKQEREQRESESQQRPTGLVESRGAKPWVASPEIVEAAHQSPGWHGVMNSEAAAKLIGTKQDAWLLRENKDKLITLTRVDGNRVIHTLITSDLIYRRMVQFISAHPNDYVRA